MALRNEWTEWHGVGNTWTEEPEDRVLSFVYKELSGSGEVKKSLEETWRSKTAPDIDALLKENGPPPRAL